MAVDTPSGLREHLGIEITYCGKDKCEGRMTVRPEVCRPGGILHGGAFMAFADTLGGAGTFPHIPAGTTTTTVESKSNFFAPIALGDTATAVSTPLHVGRTTVVMQTRITRGDGKLAAVVTQTQLVLPKR